MPKFDHRKVRGVGLHTLTKEKGVWNSTGQFTGYARVIDSAGASRAQFDRAMLDTLRLCPTEREVVAFIPSSLVVDRGKPSDVGNPHVKTSDFQLWRETLGIPMHKLREPVRRGIDNGLISTHLVDLPGFKGNEGWIESGIRKRAGIKRDEPGWGHQVVEEIAARRKKLLEKALHKHIKNL